MGDRYGGHGRLDCGRGPTACPTADDTAATTFRNGAEACGVFQWNSSVSCAWTIDQSNEADCSAERDAHSHSDRHPVGDVAAGDEAAHRQRRCEF